MIHVELVRLPLDRSAVSDFVAGDEALGGIVTFEGAVREESHPQHGRLRHLEYEAYESMAVQQLQTIARTAVERWGAGRVAIVHRLGVVPIAEISVVIAVACGHRAEAFEACRWLIESLKKDVPIWKKDVYEDGFVQWSQPLHIPSDEPNPGA